MEWRAWGKGATGSYFLGDRVSAWEDETVLAMDGREGGTAMGVYLTPLNCPPTMVNTVLCVFYHNWKTC